MYIMCYFYRNTYSYIFYINIIFSLHISSKFSNIYKFKFDTKSVGLNSNLNF